MNSSTYNNYIFNYLNNDKTGRAVLLTAPWGTGKSFYIQNDLKPFLKDKGISCVVVSLYGLHSINDISRSIYLEIRASRLMKKNEKQTIATIVGKTIVKGVAGYFGVPLEISDKDLRKLYSSMDLSGKLIVLEDLERSDIDPVSVLGFVNSLVEQDRGKVLIVANEGEINVVNPDSFRKKYHQVKEKTIGDTIYFEPDIKRSIEMIISTFENPTLQNVAEKESLSNQILRLMDELNDRNFRTLIFAIQKTIDLFSHFKEVSTGFIAQTFLGILAYSIRTEKGGFMKWEDEDSARSLGTAQYPLFLFAYRYINLQIIPSFADLETCQKFYNQEKEAKFKEKRLQDAMSVLQIYYVHKETEVEGAVKTLRDCLASPNCISIASYGTITNYLVSIRECLHDSKPIDECKEAMLQNAEKIHFSGKTNELFMKFKYSSGIQLETQSQKEEYSRFIQDLEKAILKGKHTLLKTSEVDRFIAMADEKHQYLQEMKLFSTFDPDAFAEELFSLDASKIDRIRAFFLEVYCRDSNIGAYLSGDIDNLKKLKKNVDNHLKETVFQDLIIKKQFEYLSDNLEIAINNLDNH